MESLSSREGRAAAKGAGTRGTDGSETGPPAAV